MCGFEMTEKKHNSKIDGSGFKTENAKKTAEQSEHECPSFSAGVKKEISEQKIKREADAHALLSAFTLSIGALKLMPAMRRWGVHYVLESEAALSLVSKLAAQYFGLESQLNRVKHERLNAEYCELLLHGNGIDDFLTATGLVSFDAEGEKSYEPHVPKSVIETEMQRRAFIRGLFLACGSVSEPKKAYHCELVFKNAELAMFSKRMISDFGICTKYTERKGSIVLYIKESETLSDFLALAGASDAVMVLNEQRIVRQLNNTVNRGVNCINANIEKATRTAMKQAEDIRLVLSVVGAENLPPPLRIVAEARLNNFEMPLSELAEEIGIGRSAANYRLRKLCEMAEDIRTEMPD